MPKGEIYVNEGSEGRLKGKEQRQAKGKRAKVVSNERMRRERERGKGGEEGGRHMVGGK